MLSSSRPTGDEQAIRSEIKRYFADAGDQGSANALNSALTVLLKPGITKDDRQKLLNSLDVFTRADPAEFASNRDWATGAALLSAGLPPVAAGETAIAEMAAEAASPVWKLGWAARGIYFSEQLGANLPAAFPGVDKWLDGVVTSIKSIDLNAATYQDASRLTYRLNDYIDKVATYEGGRLDVTIIDPSAISGRVLSLAIPKGSMTAVQRAAIETAQVRAQAFDVELIVTAF
jgi:hypothetical protein